MIATLILCVMVGVLTFYQIFKQGLFATTIMAVLTVAAAMIAFDYYEVLHELLLKQGLAGYPTEAGTLMGLFAISLLILRLLTDQFIKGNMKFTMLIDRVGSAVMGLFASLIMTGMIAIGFQMLPIPAKILGYDKHPDIATLTVDQNLSDFKGILGKEKRLFPYGDGLVYSIVKQASTYGFAGAEPLGRFHPDLLHELYMNRRLLSQESGSRVEAARNAITLRSARVIDAMVIDAQQNNEITMNSDELLLTVTVELRAGGSKIDPGAADVDGKIRFMMSNFRLISFDAESGRKGYVRYPLGIYDERVNIVDLSGFNQMLASTGSTPVVLMFAWPRDLKTYPPKFIEFKRWARAAMPSAGQLQTEDN